MPKTLGEALREARLNAGLSLRDASRVTGMSTSQISQLENGVRPDPAFSTVLKFVRGLRISLDALVSSYAPGSLGSIPASAMEPTQREYLALMAEVENAQGTAERLATHLREIVSDRKIRKTKGKKPK